MKKILFLLCTLFLLLVTWQSNGQNVTVTGATHTTPNLAASYSTLASAITALNGITAISGSVSITLATGYKEMAPAGGYSISFSATATSSDTIIIDGGPTYDTIVANNSLTAGALNDAIFKIIGCDYVTIKRFSMYENTANTITTLASNNMTEWGVALLRSSATNGAQHNSILDNTISLDRTYSNTFGIYSNVRHSATVVGTASDITNISGSNYSNVFYSNRVSNVNLGIAIIGSNTDARMDDSNDVGGSSSATGNTITNWGGTSLPTGTFAGNMANQYYGIFMRAQKNGNTSWNTVTSSTSLSGSVAAIVRGIHNSTTTGTITGSFSTTIDHNTVTITDNLPTGSSSLSRLDGIICTDKLADGTLSISDNTIVGLAVTGSASGRSIRAISNSASASEVYIDRNTIKGNTTTASASGGWFMAIDQTGAISNVLEINYNLIGDNASTTPAITYSATANGATVVRGINHNSSSNPTGTASISINGNTFYGFVQANSPTNGHIYINCDHTTTINSDMHIDGNHFVNIDAHVSGDVSFINSAGTMATSAGAQLSVSNNDIVGTFTKSLAGGDVYLYNAGGSSSTGNTMTESGNNFSNITLSGSAIMHGWYNNEGATAAGPEKHIINNTFNNWTCGTSGTATTNGIYCNWASGTSEISGNVVTDITGPADVNGILSASTTTTALYFNKDKVGNIKSSGSGFSVSLYKLGGGSGDLFLQNIYGVAEYSVSGNGSLYATSFGAVNFANMYINYCTLYLNMTVTNPSATFNTGGLKLPANSSSSINNTHLRNNILVNRSTGGAGISVALWRTAAALDNFDASSNNNDYFAGTPGTAHLIYYDGTNAEQTVAAYRSFITQTGSPLNATNVESASFSVNPDFISTVFNSYDVLRLVKTSVNNCPLFKSGNNNGIGLATDVDGQPRRITAPYITDIGFDQVTFTNTWTGLSSANPTDWNDPLNWDLNVVPDDIRMSVYIPNVTPTYQQPLLSTSYPYPFQVDDVKFETGLSSSLLPLLTNNYWLKIAGEITGDAGSFENHGPLLGSIEMNGVCGPQTIDGSVFVGNTVNNFTVSNDVTVSSLTGAGVKVVGELGFGQVSNKTLNTGAATGTASMNENITLISDENRTANVAQINITPTTGNTIVGDVIVERYIATGPGTNQHASSWQFLSTPTYGSQTVLASWMEDPQTFGDDHHPGYGANLSGPGGNINGFDQSSTPFSMKYHNLSTQTFVGIANTSIAINDKRGYFLLVRGDRSVTCFGSGCTATPTTLRQKQSLYQPSAPPPGTTGIGAGQYASIGNPYASPIDLNSMVTGGSGFGFTNLSNIVAVWDPLLPGTSNLGAYQYLDASTGFMASPGGSAYYNTTDYYYTIQSGQAFFVEGDPAGSGGGSVQFDEVVKTSQYKLVNRGSTPVKTNNRQYFKATLYSNNGNVVDGTSTSFDPSLSNEIDANDAFKLTNPGENFMMVRGARKLAIEARASIADTDTIFYTFSNMLKQEYQLGFVLKNLKENGLYVTLIDNYLHTQTRINLSDSSLIKFSVDENAASYSDRFNVIFQRGSLNDAEQHSAIVVNSNNKEVEKTPFFSVYPNPVENKKLDLHFINQPSGVYQLQLISTNGQTVYTGSTTINDKTVNSSVRLDKSLPTGNYQLCVTSANGIKLQQLIFVK